MKYAIFWTSLVILVIIIGLGVSIYHDYREKRIYKILKGLDPDTKIYLKVRNHKLIFEVNGLSSKIYVFEKGSPGLEEYYGMVPIKVDNRDALEFYRKQLKTVGDLLAMIDYEKEEFEEYSKVYSGDFE